MYVCTNDASYETYMVLDFHVGSLVKEKLHNRKMSFIDCTQKGSRPILTEKKSPSHYISQYMHFQNITKC